MTNQFKDALEDIFGPTLKGDFSIVEKKIILADKIARNADTIRLALRIAQAVTEEPSLSSISRGYGEFEKGGAPSAVTRRAFRAMIEQMMREIQDGSQ